MDETQTAALLEFLIGDEDFLSDSSSSESDWGSESDWSELEFDYLVSKEPSVIFKKHINYKLSDGHPSLRLDDAEYFENFRVNRALLRELADKYRESSFFHFQVGAHGKLSAYDEILMFLWFAGHNVGFREVSLKFHTTTSTCHRVTRRVAAFLRSIFDVIKWPDEDGMAESCVYFQKRGIPLAIGALNVTHIEIDKPIGDMEVYRNKSKKFSIQLQVICDHKKRIIHMYAGAPGSETVADVFEGSGLPDGLEAACGDYTVLGDHGYPCMRNLVTPYRLSEDLTAEQERFNETVAVGKDLVDRCFAKLRKKFPQLNHCRIRSLEDINNFVTACCVLHNMSIDDPFLVDVEIPPEHNSHYFLVNGDVDREVEIRLNDVTDVVDFPEGVSYRDNLLLALRYVSGRK